MVRDARNFIDFLCGKVVKIEEFAVSSHDNLLSVVYELRRIHGKVRQKDGDNLLTLFCRVQLKQFKLPVQPTRAQKVFSRVREHLRYYRTL